MNLRISLVQMHVATADPERNLARGEAWIAEAARQGSEMVCFPEMWTTGFDWEWNAAHLGEQDAVIERVAADGHRSDHAQDAEVTVLDLAELQAERPLDRVGVGDAGDFAFRRGGGLQQIPASAAIQPRRRAGEAEAAP